MALRLPLKRLLADLRLEPFLGVHLLEASVLGLQLLQALHHRSIHAAVFTVLLIKQAAAHAVFPAKISNRYAGLCLLQNRHDLAVAESRLSHFSLLLRAS